MDRADVIDSEGAAQVALITAPDLEVAARLARAFVGERLAACVNLVPGVHSIYRWEGKVEDDAEVLLVVKTHATRRQALAARLRELHPYDVPELVFLDVSAGSAPYLEWIAKEVSP